MRLATILSLVLLVGFCTAALADKEALEKQPIAYGLEGREVVAEVEPNDDCPGQLINCGDVVDPAGINPETDIDWYQFWAEAGDEITCTTMPGAPPDVYDTRIWLYDDTCSEPYLAYNDDFGGTYYSQIVYTATYSGYYNLKVDSYYQYYAGSYMLTVDCLPATPPPANDTCDGCIPIERCTSGQLEGDTSNAMNDYDLGYSGSCTGYSSAGNDVTYCLDLVEGDVVHLFYYGGYDESFYIVTDCDDVVGTCVVGADDTVGSGETIDWECTATGMYYLIVDSWSGEGPFTLDWDITCPTPTEEVSWGQIKSTFK